MNTRVIIVDDHEIFSQGLRALLEKQANVEVVATASDGRQALKLVRDKRPDMVIMDASMPGMNGIEATKRIATEMPGIKLLCLSMHAEPRYVQGILEAGGNGYLLKECALEELESAIKVVMRGETFLSPAIAGVVVSALREHRTDARPSALSVLSQREREVLQLLAEGHKPRQIAEQLHLSAKTVATHREHIMEKLGIDNIAGLTKYAILEGLTSPDPQ